MSVKKYILAIDLGGTNLRLAWFNNGVLEDLEIYPTPENHRELIQIILDKSRNPIAIGLAAPGFWDKTLILRQSINLPNYINQVIWPLISTKLNIPVFLASDTELAAWGLAVHEYRLKFSNLLYINFGTGFGAGLYKDGKTFATSYSPTLRLDFLVHPERAFVKGTQNLVDIEYDSANLLSSTLINLCFVLSPQIIVFGGGKVNQTWDTHIAPAIHQAKPYLDEHLVYSIEFAKQKLEHPALYGAYELVLNSYKD